MKGNLKALIGQEINHLIHDFVPIIKRKNKMIEKKKYTIANTNAQVIPLQSVYEAKKRISTLMEKIISKVN